MVITGASRGIGAATARLAAARGYAVCVNYLKNRAAADGVVAEIESNGGQAIAVAADVAAESEVVRLFEAVDRQLGTLTALVNNAGMLETQMRVDEMDAARLGRIFAANVTSCFLCAREAVRRMSSKYGGSGGAIVNVSSAASRLGSAGEYVDYAASKGAVDTLTIGLAREVATEGIRVNAVRPASSIRHTRQRRRTRAGRPRQGVRADEARRARRGSRHCDPVAAVGRGLLCNRHVHRPGRRQMIPAARSDERLKPLLSLRRI